MTADSLSRRVRGATEPVAILSPTKSLPRFCASEPVPGLLTQAGSAAVHYQAPSRPECRGATVCRLHPELDTQQLVVCQGWVEWLVVAHPPARPRETCIATSDPRQPGAV